MSREAMLAGLRDIRLPAEAPGGALADLAAAVALAALAALLVVLALRVVSRRRRVERVATLAERITALGALPDEDRRVALLHLLKERAPERLRALDAGLYRPGGVDLSRIEAEVARLD